jgi:hypothetical protein
MYGFGLLDGKHGERILSLVYSHLAFSSSVTDGFCSMGACLNKRVILNYFY